MPRTESQTETGVQTEVGVDVSVETWTQTLNYATTHSIMYLMDYIDHRGLGVEKLTQLREELEDAIWICLSSRTLQKIIVEVYDNDSGDLVERFDLKYQVTEPEDLTEDERRNMQSPEEAFESYHDEIVEALSEYDAPPAGCSYRVLLACDEDVPDLGPMWGPAQTKDIPEDIDRNALGDAFETGPINAEAELWI